MQRLPVGMGKLGFNDLFILACLHEDMSASEIITLVRMDISNVRKRLRKIKDVFGEIRETTAVLRRKSPSRYSVRYRREINCKGKIVAKACHDALQLILEAYHTNEG